MDQGPTHRRVSRLFATAIGALVLSLVATTAVLAASAVDSLVEVESSNGDLASGALEWSGASYNAESNVLMTVDDELNAYEIPLNPNGWINHSAPVRVLDLAIGVSDFEGVAWISGQTYAFLSEQTGNAYIIDVPSGNTVTHSDVAWQFVAGGPDGNTGSEGIAVDSTGYFYVTDEKPSSLSKFTPTGSFVAEVPLPELSDATGVVVAEDGTFLVASHESAKVVHYEIDWTAGTGTVLGEVDAASFSQLEGIAMIANTDLHLFGELKGGQTFSHMSGSIVAEIDAADVNCSGNANIIDALIIAKISAGTAQSQPGCGSGDVNIDGRSNVIDAMLVAQCAAGLTNSVCD